MGDQEEFDIGIYKTIFDQTTEGILLTDSRGRIRLANPSLLRLFGYQEKEILGETIEIFIPKELREKHVRNRDDYNKAPSVRKMGQGMFLNGLKKDGNQFPVEISLSHYNKGDHHFVVAIVTDVSSKKEADDKIKSLNAELENKIDRRTKELQRSHHLYSQIARNFPNGTINVFDKDLNYIFVEGKELFKFGIQSNMLIGSNYIDKLPKDVASEVQEKLQGVFQGSGQQFIVTVQDNIYELSAVPLFNDEIKEIDQILVVERNITTEKKAEEKIKKSLEREKELNELKGRFVSMASHEFRTPLSSVYSSANLLEKYTTTEQQERRTKHINRIKSSVTNLIGILDDILLLSRVEEGKIQLTIEEVNIEALANEAVDEMQGLINRGQKIEFINNGCDGFMTDAKLIKNITLNLLSNAVKYSYDDGKISFQIECTDKELKLVVTDHGIGIPYSDQEQLFERFFRAKNVTNIEGTGLGLNIVKKYTDLLDGQISFESVPEQETSFTVVIPCAKNINHE